MGTAPTCTRSAPVVTSRDMEPTRLWQLWSAYVGDDEHSRDEWSVLIGRWSEPHRAYHTLEHLLFMLELLDAESAEPATMLAAWYHDAVYDPRSSTNEADSARLAEQALPGLGLGELAPRVGDLVRMTAEHERPEGDTQAGLLLDADLAILGQSPALYLRYVEGVRAEYAHVSDADFRRGRTAILNGLLDRDRLFEHPAFTALESPARANVQAELAVYGNRSPER